VRAAGKTYAQASEHKWAEWQVPPVLCPTCGKRVTLKDAFFGSHALGTFHAEHAPYATRKDNA
jgi:hypothetical protein